MIDKIANVGYVVHGQSIGELWMQIVETVVKNGKFEFDENRGRFAVRNLRFSSETTLADDDIINRFGDQSKIAAMKRVVFESDQMQDFDITPSFRNGAKSYKKRLEEGDMVNFVVKRLAKIPESKKAVYVFPTYEDYRAVTDSPWNDYLPCIVALQFRLVTSRNRRAKLDLTLFMRSWDGYQKGAGDLVVVCMMADTVREKLSQALGVKILPGRLDGLVTDVHVYENTLEDAQGTLFDYLHAKGDYKVKK